MDTLIVQFQDYEDVTHEVFVNDLNLSEERFEELVEGQVIGYGTLKGEPKPQSLRQFVEYKINTKRQFLDELEAAVTKSKRTNWEKVDAKYKQEMAHVSGNLTMPSIEYHESVRLVPKTKEEIEELKGLLVR